MPGNLIQHAKSMQRWPQQKPMQDSGAGIRHLEHALHVARHFLVPTVDQLNWKCAFIVVPQDGDRNPCVGKLLLSPCWVHYAPAAQIASGCPPISQHIADVCMDSMLISHELLAFRKLLRRCEQSCMERNGNCHDSAACQASPSHVAHSAASRPLNIQRTFCRWALLRAHDVLAFFFPNDIVCPVCYYVIRCLELPRVMSIGIGPGGSRSISLSCESHHFAVAALRRSFVSTLSHWIQS